MVIDCLTLVKDDGSRVYLKAELKEKGEGNSKVVTCKNVSRHSFGVIQQVDFENENEVSRYAEANRLRRKKIKEDCRRFSNEVIRDLLDEIM